MRWCGLLVTVAFACATVACGDAQSTRPPDGQSLFERDCSTCHTLSGVNSPSHQGGDLLGAHLSRSVLVQFVREMPVRDPLTQPQLAAVTSYILAVAHRQP